MQNKILIIPHIFLSLFSAKAKLSYYYFFGDYLSLKVFKCQQLRVNVKEAEGKYCIMIQTFHFEKYPK